jgi:hypothetical protein
VRIVAQGTRLQVQVNYEPVLEVQDDREPWGAISIGVGAALGESAEAGYRNFTVRAP